MKKKILLLPAFFIGAAFWFAPLTLAQSVARQKTTLPESVPLKLRYKVGETLCYRLKRLNNNFRIDGTKSGEMRVITYFTRTRLPDDALGRVQERFIWKRFEFGQSTTADPARLTEFKEAENFTLDLSVNEDMAIEKFDFSSLPRTMDGFMFMILTWDAVTFDGLTRPTPGLRIPDEAPLGAQFEDRTNPRDFVFSFPPLVTESKYTFSGKSWVKLVGLSLVKGLPCALLQAGQMENRVVMNMHLKPLELQNRGFEHFWAQTYLSLEDGRIVRGELVGPIVITMDLQGPGQDKPQRSELLAIGYLEMDLLPEAEFNSELRKSKEGAPAVK
jgi:hypothetical protein